MFKSRIIKAKRKGSALVLAILAMLILFIMGGSMLTLGYLSRVFYTRNSDDIRARCAADAAMAKAFYEMNQKLLAGDFSSLPYASSVSLEGCSAAYNYQVTSISSRMYAIQATGVSNGRQRTVQATLVKNNPFEFAVFAQDNLSLKNSGKIDWYNNEIGDAPLKVGTNSTQEGAVDLKNFSEINGDVVVGVDGNPTTVISKSGDAIISGDTYAQTETSTLPSVTVPAYLSSLSAGETISDNTVIGSSGKYTSIDLGNSKTITIRGPVELYITEGMTLGNSAEVKIDSAVPNSSLTLYLAGNLEAKNSSVFNNETQIPSKFKLYCLDSCTSLDFKNGSDIYGVIYAPKADIVYHNSADIYGSVIGKSLEIKSTATINYDASLRDGMTNDPLVTLKVVRWKE